MSMFQCVFVFFRVDVGLCMPLCSPEWAFVGMHEPAWSRVERNSQIFAPKNSVKRRKVPNRTFEFHLRCRCRC